MKRIAVKIGSNVLTRKDGTLDITRMSALVDQVADLHRQGMEIVLISSGAVAYNPDRQKAGSRISPATVFGGRTGQVDQPVLRVIPGAWHDLRASAYYKREFRESYALPKPEALHGGNA
mgnify:CR=1 FL=1